MASFGARVVGALALRARTYEEVEHDRTATGQAAVVVVLSAVSAGLGALGRFGSTGMLRQTTFALVGWVVSAAVLWLVGTKILRGRRTEGGIDQLLRTLGFAQAPGLFAAALAAPTVGWIAAMVIPAWTLLAIVIGVRQALDYESTLRALLVCLIGWSVWMAISMAGALAGFGLRVF